MNVREAKSLAFGSKMCTDLDEYYEAWQWLHDHSIKLEQPDIEYMDKLICDGHITIDK